MKSITTKHDSLQPVADTAVYLFDDWFDPIEAAVRDRVRGFIQAMIEGELDEKLQRPRYGRRPKSSKHVDDGGPGVNGHRHGHRSRSLTGTFGRIALEMPRARLVGPGGETSEWKSKVLRAYQRRTLAADALIASAYLAGTNTRRVRRALKALFAEGVGKDVVSRVWRKVKSDWEAWNARSLAEEPIVRLILDGNSCPARSKSHGNLAACRDRRARRRPEGIACDQEHGRRKHRSLSQWRSARTTNAIERLHEEFKRRIKTQTVLPSAETAAMLFWALLASGQINMRKVDGWATLAAKPTDQPIDLAA